MRIAKTDDNYLIGLFFIVANSRSFLRFHNIYLTSVFLHRLLECSESDDNVVQEAKRTGSKANRKHRGQNRNHNITHTQHVTHVVQVSATMESESWVRVRKRWRRFKEGLLKRAEHALRPVIFRWLRRLRKSQRGWARTFFIYLREDVRLAANANFLNQMD